MMDTEIKAWLKCELVKALGFAEVDEIVNYISNTFVSKQEASSYLIELLGIPAKRAEHISTRLFSPVPSFAKPAVNVAAAPACKHKELVRQPKILNVRPKLSKKDKQNKKAASELLNNALIINCLRCGCIEYNGARCCAFCDSELHYEADAFSTDQAARQHMEEIVQLDETGAQRPRVGKKTQYFYDEQDAKSDAQSSSGRRPITMALNLNNQQSGNVKITRNEQLARDARELMDSIQEKLSKVKRGESSLFQQPEDLSAVMDDLYNLAFV